MTGSGMQPSGTVTPGTRYRNPFEKNAAAAAAAAGASAPHTYPGSYQGFQQGGYSGGRPPNQTANRGSPSGRDTSLSSPSPSIATDGDRSRAPVARNRSRSRSRPPVPPHQQYPAEPVRPPPSVSAAPPPRERGRSKSVARSKSQSRARSRARSKSRYRSLSRPVRQAISAGTYERTHRSPSRSKRGRYDYSDSSSEDSGSDSDYYERSRRRKRRRRYSSSEDDSSFLDDSEYSDDDVTEVDANGDRTRVDTTNFTPAERVNGPMLDMMSELKRLTDRYSEREEKQRRTHKRIRRITKQLSSEVRGLRKEIAGRPAGDQAWDSRSAAQPTQSMPPPRQSKPSTPRSTPRSTPQHTPPPGQNARPGHRAQQEGELVSLEYADQRPGTSRSRASTWSGAALGAPGGQEPLRPPPSLIPASAGVAVKTEDDRDDTLSLNRRHRRRMTGDGQMADPAAPSSSSSGGPPLPSSPPPPTGPNYATDPARSVGPRRVFDRATYDLPIGNQQLMSVISLGGASEGERVGSGRNPRPMVLNPFSRGTAFEDIAVVNSLDGMIMFWDIRAQRKVAEIAPKLSRVIPYAETLTWVSEDTLVAVSHLKYGLSWSDPKPVTDATATTADGLAPDPDRFSRPETQTNLITVFWNRDGSLKYKVFTIHGHPHDKPILNVCAVMGEHDQSMGYVTGGNDKHLIHWRFTRLEDGGFIGGGMVDVHKLHTNAIMCTMYSHTSKRFYSGGLDGRYIVYDMEHMQVIHNEKPGKFVHLLQNPADPRIHAAVKVEPQHQLFLMDERVPGQKVLTLDNHGTNAVSKSTHPSWHTEGGLLCSGTDVDGMINIWDVRWAGMRHTENERPGYGVVTADLSANGIQSARASVDDPAYLDLQHPIFWPGNRPSRTHHSRSSSSRKGGPSQVLDVGGKKVGQALFHPTRNVMMVQSFDSTLTFIDYNMINKSIV
ncbi:hypothetical protein BGX33_005855 [Mortierella sp. NVP41]|nr:hypothetical protein BGX33_005855 [Mortierella sp. NVP41]